MVLRYFDTSVVLSLLLSDSHADRAMELWAGDFARVSSSLLVLEIWVQVHKYARRLPLIAQRAWGKEAGTWVKKTCDQFYLHEIDAAVRSEIEEDVLYGQCRTLDAVHLATARILARECRHLEVATFDDRMRQGGEALGLTILA